MTPSTSCFIPLNFTLLISKVNGLNSLISKDSPGPDTVEEEGGS